MHGRKQFRNSFLNIIWRAATAAFTIAVVFTLTVVLTPSARAQTPATSASWTEKVLHSFGSGSDGIYPTAALIFHGAGHLYGTTYEGGPRDAGMVFGLTPGPDAVGERWTEEVLHSFGQGADGGYAQAGLILDAAGNLYGTTYYGGTYGKGTVFELTPTVGGGWTEKVLYSFCSQTNCADGAEPYAGLIFDTAGNLYGTTYYGGAYTFCYGGCGTAFELTPTVGGSWTEKVLHSFNQNGTDGFYPSASLIFDTAGNLYGTTWEGGSGTYPLGTAFELTPTAGGGWTEKVLHSFNFNGTDGVQPLAGLIFDAAGNLYGTTLDGGPHAYGTVFVLTPTAGGGWTEKVLHAFGNPGDGAELYAGLIFDAAGNLYGTTVNGGTSDNCRSYNNLPGCGTVFELTSAGGVWTETVLHSFNDNGTDGFYPEAGLILDAAGNLYGTTFEGGTYSCIGYGCGTVFELTPN